VGTQAYAIKQLPKTQRLYVNALPRPKNALTQIPPKHERDELNESFGQYHGADVINQKPGAVFLIFTIGHKLCSSPQKQVVYTILSSDHQSSKYDAQSPLTSL
jgi:hypothetical protein